MAETLAQRLFRRWGWIEVPPGYELLEVTDDSYTIFGVQGGPFQLPNHEAKWIGWKKYKVRRRTPSFPIQPAQPEPAPQHAARRTAAYIEPEPIRIPAGSFWMGSADNDPDAKYWPDEKPRHRVYVGCIANCV